MTTEPSAPNENGEAANPIPAQPVDSTPAPTGTSVNEGQPAAAETVGTQQTVPEGEPPASTDANAENKDGDKPAEIPETYEFTMPEGMPLDEAAAGELTTVAHELKLNQEQVNKLTQIGIQMRQRDAENHANNVKAWAEAMQTDSELGGDAFKENLALARKTLQSYASPGLREALQATGLDQHPEMFRFVHSVGKALAEDRFTPGATGTSVSEEDRAKRMYPSMDQR